MLVLSRTLGEMIEIGVSIKVQIISVKGTTVRVGVEALAPNGFSGSDA